MSYGRAEKARRMRGQILEMLATNHDKRQSRLDSSLVWSILVRSGFDVSKDEVTTLCEDLEARGYIKYQLNKRLYEKTGDRLYMQMELCPKGRDLLEATFDDPAVEV